MDNTADYYMICGLMEQIRFTCVALEDLREIAETPEERERIDAILNGNKKVIERAKEELKTVAV